MENLGETFVDGRIINLDSTSKEDLQSYLSKVRESKKLYKEKLNNFLEEIYS